MKGKSTFTLIDGTHCDNHLICVTHGLFEGVTVNSLTTID